MMHCLFLGLYIHAFKLAREAFAKHPRLKKPAKLLSIDREINRRYSVIPSYGKMRIFRQGVIHHNIKYMATERRDQMMVAPFVFRSLVKTEDETLDNKLTTVFRLLCEHYLFCIRPSFTQDDLQKLEKIAKDLLEV